MLSIVKSASGGKKVIFLICICISQQVSQCRAEDKGTLLWSFHGTESMTCVSSIRDVNGNGFNDVLVGTWNDTLFCFEGKSQDSAIILWTFTFGRFDDLITDTDTISDVNGDGICDVVVSSFGHEVFCLDGQSGDTIWMFYANSVKNLFPKEKSSTYTWLQPMGDVNGDGICDVVVVPRELYKAFCIDGASKDSATVLWSFPLSGYARSSYSVTSLKDVNGDSVAEAVIGASESSGHPVSCVYCISGKTGDTLWIYDNPEMAAECVSTIEDVNNNGTQDVLLGTQLTPYKAYCLEGNTGKVIWEYSAGANMLKIISIDDINGDGKREAILGCGSGSGGYLVACIEGDSDSLGHLLWSFPAGYIVNHLEQTSDIDGDLIRDIAVGTWNGHIFCISGKTGTPIWSYSGTDTTSFGDIMGMTTLKDVNGDGFDEVVGVTYGGGSHHGEVWCISGKAYRIEEKPNPAKAGSKITALPNPFVNSTTIRYLLPAGDKKAKITIHDVSGRLVRQFPANSSQLTNNEIKWDGKDNNNKTLPAGIYFIKSNTNENSLQKLVKLR
ncbi:MAG: PQQ-binding-like beta-propeller repeat protein [bacterium]